ncbi:MBL fold metallo-hydrolase [Microbispora sp. NEAU-D428]|uniref:MBL fold metallo-hydrolase n=1 Tax=Microbispora sitophila TaxID=2771537 RepID=UPI001865CE59|nr:MBL fold metallo-hydrolase [Microbispora sitophila]MBE3014545.1 MBL fold metallo-hydrolase [Microbispora sitophila]
MDTQLTGPWRIAPDVVLVPMIEPAAAGYAHINSMVITGREPVIVDTGAAEHRERWTEDVFSVVEPRDVRWIFLSHDDPDHAGNLEVALEMCPGATLVTGSPPRPGRGFAPPPGRTRRIDDDESFDAGDRRLTAVRPPLYDAPATRGLYDDRSGVYWAADCFGAGTPVATADAGDLPLELYLEAVRAFGAGLSPWHRWLDPRIFGRYVDRLAAMEIIAIASAHGPTATGDRVAGVIGAVRRLAGNPDPRPDDCGP